MPQRLLLWVMLVLALTLARTVGAQPFSVGGANVSIGRAEALAARIRAFHHWQGLTAPPPGYCETMREGEAVEKELSVLASRAILYRHPGLALALQSAGNQLSDALDEEEQVNRQAEIRYTVFPCPAPPPPYPSRALVLRLVLPLMPRCRREADALRLTFAGRRAHMEQCLRIRGT